MGCVSLCFSIIVLGGCVAGGGWWVVVNPRRGRKGRKTYRLFVLLVSAPIDQSIPETQRARVLLVSIREVHGRKPRKAPVGSVHAGDREVGG